MCILFFQEADFVNFMKDPQNPGATPPPPAAEPPEKQWEGVNGMENLHFLTDDNFDSFVQEEKSVLVMFYAPCMLSACVVYFIRIVSIVSLHVHI